MDQFAVEEGLDCVQDEQLAERLQNDHFSSQDDHNKHDQKIKDDHIKDDHKLKDNQNKDNHSSTGGENVKISETDQPNSVSEIVEDKSVCEDFEGSVSSTEVEQSNISKEVQEKDQQHKPQGGSDEIPSS